MKKTLLTVLSLALVLLSAAQQYDCNCVEQDGLYNNYLQNLLISREYYNPVSYYRGDQYFNTWSPGEVVLSNGEKVTGISLRYQKYLDELLWLRNSDFRTAIVSKSIVSGFIIYDENQQTMGRFTKKSIKLPGTVPFDAYVEVLAEGRLDFYVFRNVVKAISESRFVDNTTYYVSLDDGGMRTIRLRRRSLIKLPGIDSELMKNIIRTNHIAFHKDEAQVAAAVRLYNEAVMQ